MSLPAFTPGPWRILPEEVGRNYIRIRGSKLGNRYKVANVLQVVTDVDAKTMLVETIETRANAQLIAAAPDLLAALKELTHSYCSHDWCIAGRAAIARAEGRV